ncbi:MAG: beta strand repeat-containing protein [Nitrososphaerales archaeon]
MSYGVIRDYFRTNNNGANNTITITPISSSDTVGTFSSSFQGLYSNTAFLTSANTSSGGYLNLIESTSGTSSTGSATIYLGPFSSTIPSTTSIGDLLIQSSQNNNYSVTGSSITFGTGFAAPSTSETGGASGTITFNNGGVGWNGGTSTTDIPTVGGVSASITVGDGGTGGGVSNIEYGVVLAASGGPGLVIVVGNGGNGGDMSGINLAYGAGDGGNAGSLTIGTGGNGGNINESIQGSGSFGPPYVGNGGNAFSITIGAGGTGASGIGNGTIPYVGSGGNGSVISIGGGGSGGSCAGGLNTTGGNGGLGCNITLGGGGGGSGGEYGGNGGNGATITVNGGGDGIGGQYGSGIGGNGATLVLNGGGVGGANTSLVPPAYGKNGNGASLTLGGDGIGSGSTVQASTGAVITMNAGYKGATIIMNSSTATGGTGASLIVGNSGAASSSVEINGTLTITNFLSGTPGAHTAIVTLTTASSTWLIPFDPNNPTNTLNSSGAPTAVTIYLNNVTFSAVSNLYIMPLNNSTSSPAGSSRTIGTVSNPTTGVSPVFNLNIYIFPLNSLINNISGKLDVSWNRSSYEITVNVSLYATDGSGNYYASNSIGIFTANSATVFSELTGIQLSAQNSSGTINANSTVTVVMYRP